MSNPARNTIKLAAGVYGIYGTIASGTVVVYGEGPATSLTAGLNVSGGTLRVRNISLAPTAILAAIPPTQGDPIPTLDIEGVTFMGAQGAGNLVYPNPGILSIRRSSFICTGTCAAFVYADGNSSLANYGSHVTIDETVFAGADPLIQFGLADVSVTNTVFANPGPMYGTFQFNTGGHPIGPSSISQSTFYNARLVCPASGSTITSDSNIFLNTTSGAPSDTVTGASCTHAYDLIKPQATAVGASNLLNMDPQFVSPAANDFHLMSTSPAIDKANPASSDAHDLDGTSRPQGSRNDIGAYEYH